jgi:type VI secretion system protein
MRPTLFERLRDPGPPGERHTRIPISQVTGSILANLQSILNTNQGNCLTDPDYGLPHLTSIQSTMPDSLRSFMNAIRNAIARNEPRLQGVDVRHVPTADNRFELRFEIAGTIFDDEVQRAIRFETYIDDEGQMVVR